MGLFRGVSLIIISTSAPFDATPTPAAAGAMVAVGFCLDVATPVKIPINWLLPSDVNLSHDQ